jgi:16S rRNA (guanine527-N7)-methyltransferase
MQILLKYFPKLTEIQIEQFRLMEPLYTEWNSKINVISRKDIAELYERHILHSLSVAKFIRFQPSTSILDVGTGGGFPGIPLAVFFPEVKFHLVDSIGKKIKVVNEVIQGLELKNAVATQVRAEQISKKYDFILSRAVTQLPEFVELVRKNISKDNKNAIPNGILYLKGGNIDGEIHAFRRNIYIQKLSEYFDEEYFETKKLVHLIL